MPTRRPPKQHPHPVPATKTKGRAGDPLKSGSNGTQNEAPARADISQGTELKSAEGAQAQDTPQEMMRSSVEPEQQQTEDSPNNESSRDQGRDTGMYRYGLSLNSKVKAAQARAQHGGPISSKEGKKEDPIDPAVATPGMTIAYQVQSAKVDIHLGAVNIETGDRVTVVKEGGEVEIANQCEDADVKIQVDDVTMKLGDDVAIQSVGGGLRLDALGSTTVNVEAGAMNINMEDKGKLTVHGVDLEGEVSNADIHKGAVDIQMGKGAEVEIRGPLPSNLHEVKDSKDEDDNTLTIRAESKQRLVLEAGEDSNDEERTLKDDIVTKGRQAYKILHPERLIVWKGLRRCQNRKCESKRLAMELGEPIVVVDIRGRHDLPSCVCVCKSCNKRMLPRKETYLAHGFWPLESGRLDYLIDVELFRFYESVQACCKELSPQTFLQALGNFSAKCGRNKELSEAIFLKAFFEWKGQTQNS